MIVTRIRRRHLAGGLIGGLALLAAACSGVPTSTDPVSAPTRIEREVPVATNTQLPVARAGMSPPAVVNDFIKASAQSGGRHDAAKAFLTPDAQRVWRDNAGATIGTVQYIGSFDIKAQTVDVQLTEVGQVDAAGVFTATPSVSNYKTVKFHLRRDAKTKRWQISQLPGPGVILSPANFNSIYTPINLYFLNRGQDPRVVPDPRYFDVPPLSLASAVAQALVNGPSARLRPAVDTAIPPKARLRQGVVAKSPLQIDLRGIGGMTQTQLHGMAAQFVWTMDQVRPILHVERLQILSEGTVDSIKGFGTQPLSKDSWLSYDPEAMPPGAATSYLIQDGDVIRGSDGQRVPGASGLELSSVAVSVDGQYIAGVARNGKGATLYVGKYAGRLRAVLHQAQLTTPTWLPDDQLLLVSNRRDLLRFSAASPSGSPASYTNALASIPGVRSLRVSLDGARVAVVSLDGTVYTGVVGSTAPIVGLAQLVDAPSDATQVAWSGATELTILAPDPNLSLPMAVWTAEVDSIGGKRSSLPTSGLPDSPVALAAAPNQYTIVQPKNQDTPFYYNSDDETWSGLPSNDGFPLQGSAPTYPG